MVAARGLVKPEVLAPVGGWPQLRAAVENGADAVYFGLTDFNARARWVGLWWRVGGHGACDTCSRAGEEGCTWDLRVWHLRRASNFTPEELPDVMTYLHDRVRVETCILACTCRGVTKV